MQGKNLHLGLSKKKREYMYVCMTDKKKAYINHVYLDLCVSAWLSQEKEILEQVKQESSVYLRPQVPPAPMAVGSNERGFKRVPESSYLQI
jgi:hypothetical protein